MSENSFQWQGSTLSQGVSIANTPNGRVITVNFDSAINFNLNNRDLDSPFEKRFVLQTHFLRTGNEPISLKCFVHYAMHFLKGVKIECKILVGEQTFSLPETADDLVFDHATQATEGCIYTVLLRISKTGELSEEDSKGNTLFVIDTIDFEAFL